MIDDTSSWPKDLTEPFLLSNISCERIKSSLNLIHMSLFQKDHGGMTENRIGSTSPKRLEEAVQCFLISELILCLLKSTHF